MKNIHDIEKLIEKRNIEGLFKIYKDKHESPEIRNLALNSIQKFSETSILMFQ